MADETLSEIVTFIKNNKKPRALLQRNVSMMKTTDSETSDFYQDQCNVNVSSQNTFCRTNVFTIELSHKDGRTEIPPLVSTSKTMNDASRMTLVTISNAESLAQLVLSPYCSRMTKNGRKKKIPQVRLEATVLHYK